MSELIVSIYDGGYGFTAQILKDNNIEKTFKHEEDLNEYDLYDNHYNWFSNDLITKTNEKIKQFDKIIVCEDGCIDVYVKGVNY